MVLSGHIASLQETNRVLEVAMAFQNSDQHAPLAQQIFAANVNLASGTR